MVASEFTIILREIQEKMKHLYMTRLFSMHIIYCAELSEACDLWNWLSPREMAHFYLVLVHPLFKKLHWEIIHLPCNSLFQGYNTVAFSWFPGLCNHHLRQFWEILITPKRNPCTPQPSPLQSPHSPPPNCRQPLICILSLKIGLFWTQYKWSHITGGLWH